MPELVFLIPIIAILAGVAHKWMAMKERQFLILSERNSEQAAQSSAKTERLEQRVAVLERILTDRSTALGDEIERLRDRPIN